MIDGLTIDFNSIRGNARKGLEAFRLLLGRCRAVRKLLGILSNKNDASH